jgi:hypothetical protein
MEAHDTPGIAARALLRFAVGAGANGPALAVERRLHRRTA